jgi:ABC-type glutathione transport system ATPase component
VAFSSIADASNAISRLYGVFEAELLEETLIQDDTHPFAVSVTNASFTWDSPPVDTEPKKHRHKLPHKGQSVKPSSNIVDTEKAKVDQENVFKVKDISITVPRGQLVAIVGAVGSGKTSLLQGIIGEMRRTGGSVRFGGSVSYCAQSAWIQVGLISCCLATHTDLYGIECNHPRKCLFWTSIRRREILASYT